jgi:integrase
VPNINKETASDFEDWLFAQNYSDNYIGKHMSILKSILNGVDDVPVNIDIKKIIVISEKKEPEDIIYLSFEELEKIKGLKLTTNYLINGRKWLILGCYVGQRGSDLLKLTPDQIKIIRGRKFFQIKQKKGEKNVTIPILPEAELIIKSGFPHKISDTNLRKYFKEICELAEINEPTNGRKKTSKHGIGIKGFYPKWKLIGTHVCRRSFATNYHGIIPTVILKEITRHATEEMFLRYIGKTDEEYAMQMFNYTDKLPKVKTMEVVKNEKETGTDK